MSLLAQLKNNAITIAILIAGLAVASTVYDHFFSDRAALIKVLEKQIKEEENRVTQLQTQLAQLTEEEQKRLEEIAALKTKLGEMNQLIQKGEVKIDELKGQIISFDEALDTIEGHTRDAVARGRGLLPPADSSARE